MPPENPQNPPAPQPTQPTEPPANATGPSPLPQIRTFQGDVASALHVQKESLVSLREKELARKELVEAALTKPAAEEAKPGVVWPSASPYAVDTSKLVVGPDGKPVQVPAPQGPAPLVAPPVRPAPLVEESPEEQKSRWKGLVFALGTIVFLCLAGYAAYFAYNTYLVKTAVPTSVAPANRFLAVVSTDDIDATNLTRENLLSLTAGARAKAPAAGSLAQLELRKGATSTSPYLTSTELFLKLAARMPGNLVRAFDPLFMLGTLGGGQATSSTFLLIRLDSFENAFAGMLDWEPNMRADLAPLFQPEETVNSIPDGATWQDETLRNKDARALKAADGSTALIYSFYNQNLLIVTTDEAALRTIVDKLDAEALKR